jgi:hypothetical protein
MATIARKIKVASNPQRQPTRKSSRAANASKKGTKMATPKKKAAARKNPTTTANGSKKKNKKNRAKNPQTRKSTKHRARNPNISQLFGSPKSIAVGAASGLLAAVATRQLPQIILGANNTSWQGYGANAVAGLVASFIAGKLLGADAGKAALVGSTVIILDRILTEQFSPIGQYLALSGNGDATATGTLGTIADGYYIHPTVIDSTGKPVIPHEITDASIAAILQRFPQIAAPGTSPRPAGRQGNMGAVRSGDKFSRDRFAGR